ncbi:flavodoxin family protein [Pseudoroseicyclus tamaricis]|uniref:Flavodoxin family protein n=1 Tax=Pseudoroseicyclus tamaricis TaxID=2705421 RepID=A0A6B2JER5_9RHOB|nr:NAD(P)H-dependent oxidoreductase [Pseudoroseicyclus tamaricis]NDU99390.1 flavodoxin family protein [Pseudoroseicyclus tamaricis]
MADALSAFALTCSLRRSGQGKPSSTDLFVEHMFDQLRAHGVSCDKAHAADHNILPGVTSDEGEGDDWPALREKVLAADIFILGTPIWLGQPSSICKRILERMDAFLGESDDQSRMPPLGKVALVGVVGNEDGAHATHAACFQALSDVGFTIPANAGCYWVGEAMHGTDYGDLDEPPEVVTQTMQLAAANTVHLAKALKGNPFPGSA